LSIKGKLDCGYRIDILVEDKLIVELESVEKTLPIHEAQILTYMKSANIEVGLLINCNVERLKEGLKKDLFCKISVSFVLFVVEDSLTSRCT